MGDLFVHPNYPTPCTFLKNKAKYLRSEEWVDTEVVKRGRL